MRVGRETLEGLRTAGMVFDTDLLLEYVPDQAWHHKLMAMGGAGSTYFSVFLNISIANSKLFGRVTSHRVKDAVVTEWYVWLVDIFLANSWSDNII